ncbi:uncharacterized protein LOC128205059 [Mya arenaria]|uniref:uncharacterized protein LOC128205059 n=1 Tax=Mya arenaria TaxID=6604 RepID=UPI0022E904ED|nr:uncharacterized protein LOC128205059 [Mya arenaria]
MKNTQSALSKNGNLRLHKIASNSVQVLDALPREDLAKNLSDLDLSHGDITDVPLQRSLGLCWNIKADAFTFRVSEEEKPFTRRGVLSTINSIYDPVGVVAPVVIVGKLLLRDLMASSQDWDDPLPLDQFTVWQQWCCSLKKLNQLEIPRAYLYSVKRVARKDLHVYCDASEKAIAAVAYIVGESTAGTMHSSFVMGKIKVAPVNGHTIPRLELCAAVLASQVANTVLTHIDIDFDEVKYFSDSKVVLGYISNTTRRFYTYVSNRVQKILTNSLADQWNYVPTHLKPADIGTRGVSAEDLPASLWLNGSSWKQHQERTDFPLVAPDVDSEIRVNVLATTVSTESALDSSHFEKFSEWKSLKSAITCLQHVAESYHTKQCKGWHVGCNTNSQKAEAFILKTVQKEAFSEEYANLKVGKPVSKSSSIASLNAFIDEKDVMRVGGRLEKSNLTFAEKHPVIVPRKCHIGTLLVRHYHSSVKHQGRHFTEGALRSNGYWIVSGKRLIASVIHQCVKCKKLRGPHTHQLMADLPSDRLSPAPPFTYVGVDCFGPWNVVTRKTRGGQANSKRWAVLFTCLTIRAIHIEVIEEMSGSAFINALRRFIARFGNVQIIRSDRGTNFVGAASELKIETVNVEDGLVKDLLRKKNIQWVFNPPHAPHMGGVWERLIGVVKRILNSILSEASYKNLTHDVLSTLMAEVTAIVNARPIVPVSTDGSAPEILSPSSILTQKWDFNLHQFEHLSFADSYRVAWKNVQFLANQFWHHWRFEYLQLLQPRRKWNVEQRNIREGDVVLVKDSDVVRNQWPYGIVEKVFASEDGKVRKLSVRMQRDGQTTTLTRPITEVVLLVGNE